jgi:hypothetical protein
MRQQFRSTQHRRLRDSNLAQARNPPVFRLYLTGSFESSGYRICIVRGLQDSKGAGPAGNIGVVLRGVDAFPGNAVEVLAGPLLGIGPFRW